MGVAEVVQQRPFKQFDVLGKVHDRTPSGFCIIGHVAVVQPDATGIGCTVDASEQFGEGGFATPGRTNDGVHLIRCESNVDLVEGWAGVTGVGEGEAVGAEGGWWGGWR